MGTDIESLAKDTPGNPYRRFGSLTPEEQGTLLLADLRRLERGAAWCEAGDQAWTAITHLPWDSQILGESIGRIDCFCSGALDEGPRRLLAEAIRSAIHREGFHYLVTRISRADRLARGVLAKAGLQRVDGLVNLQLGTFPGISTKQDDRIMPRPATIADEPLVRNLVHRCYRNRLMAEPHLEAARVRSLYAEWAANDLRGRVAFTLIASLGGEPAGFLAGDVRDLEVAAVRRVGLIDLIVVDEQMRRCGVGRTLMLSAMSEFQRLGAGLLELNVAEGNHSAIRLYLALGFEEQMRSVDLALWCIP